MKYLLFLFVAITIGITSSKQNDISVPIMIHYDKALTSVLLRHYGYPKYLMQRHVFHLAKTALKDASNLLLSLYSKQRIKFHLLGVELISRNVKMSGNATRYLRSYCPWIAERKIHREDWFYSVLITGLNLFSKSKHGDIRKDRLSAHSYTKSGCTSRHSCAIFEGHPVFMGLFLAHEFAHSFGVSSDGPPNNMCKTKGLIMSRSVFVKNSPPMKWSSCSKRAFKWFIESEEGWCLRR